MSQMEQAVNALTMGIDMTCVLMSTAILLSFGIPNAIWFVHDRIKRRREQKAVARALGLIPRRK